MWRSLYVSGAKTSSGIGCVDQKRAYVLLNSGSLCILDSNS